MRTGFAEPPAHAKHLTSMPQVKCTGAQAQCTSSAELELVAKGVLILRRKFALMRSARWIPDLRGPLRSQKPYLKCYAQPLFNGDIVLQRRCVWQNSTSDNTCLLVSCISLLLSPLLSMQRAVTMLQISVLCTRIRVFRTN